MYEINRNAAVTCTMTILILANQKKVWNTLTDIDNWTKWQPSIRKSRLNGELKPQTTFDWKNEGMNIHSLLHIVDPYSNICWTGKVYGVFAVHNWILKDLNGTTQVTVSESMEGLLARLFKKYFNNMLKKEMEKSLLQLKKIIE